MRLIRDPATESLIGVFGLSLGLLSLGLAMIALQDRQELTTLSAIPLGAAGLAFVGFIALSVFVVYHAHRRDRNIKDLRSIIHEGRKLEQEIRSARKSHESDVLDWNQKAKDFLSTSLAEYLPDFELQPERMATQFADLNQALSNEVTYVRARNRQLLEILQDYRRS
jgi:hypothetical protein